jgi:lactate dehydrogenase-like 2-hydroxyacid dehydrogenase
MPRHFPSPGSTCCWTTTSNNCQQKTPDTFGRASHLFVLVSTIELRVARTGCRAVVLGVDEYRSPLYDALAAKGATALIARFGVGHDGVDKGLARKKGIAVANTPGVLDQSVAELTFWLLGAVLRSLCALDKAMKEGGFQRPQRGWNSPDAACCCWVLAVSAVGWRASRPMASGCGWLRRAGATWMRSHGMRCARVKRSCVNTAWSLTRQIRRQNFQRRMWSAFTWCPMRKPGAMSIKTVHPG